MNTPDLELNCTCPVSGMPCTFANPITTMMDTQNANHEAGVPVLNFRSKIPKFALGRMMFKFAAARLDAGLSMIWPGILGDLPHSTAYPCRNCRVRNNATRLLFHC
jgi:hypothetical protein